MLLISADGSSMRVRLREVLNLPAMDRFAVSVARFLRKRYPQPRKEPLMRLPHSICSAAFLCGMLVPSVEAEPVHWTGLLGPNRDGWVSYYRPPTQWPAALEQHWRVPVGTGYGTPLVVGDRLFQHARQGEEEVVHCLELQSGETIWRRSYEQPFQMGGGGERHGKGPKSCPAYGDGRLYTMSIAGVLSAWDARNGKVLWTADFGSRYPPGRPYWGASTSPLVDGGHVIAHVGSDKEGALVCLDGVTGKEVWQQGHDGASYSSALLVELAGVRQVVDWNHRALVGVRAEDGEPLWEYPFPHEGSNQNMPTPVLHDGHIVLGGENRGLHSLFPQRQEDGTWSVEARWHQDKVALDMSTAVINGDLLFGFSHYGAGRLFCVDVTSGEIRWQGPGRSGQNVAFLSFPGYVLALMNDGHVKVIRATGSELDEVATYRVSESSTWAPPVLLPNGLLIKDDRQLTYWRFPTEG